VAKKKILFVGVHPRSGTGNGNMMSAVLAQTDRNTYDVASFCAGNVDPLDIVFDPLPYTLIGASSEADYWGHARLVSLLQRLTLDIVCFVGIDIWQYQQAWNSIIDLQNRRGFKIVYIFPFDVQSIRMDWVKWMNDCDVPCVYSEYGQRMLADHVPQLRYFRPPLFNADQFRRFSDPEKIKIRKACFPTVPADHVIFGFVGVNQVRKSPERLLKAFMEAKERNPKITLYLHTDVESGVHNIRQLAMDFGAKSGDLITKKPGAYPVEKMVDIYNAIDCLVNCTMQEGLSWTPLEAMLCGTPCILSDTTAQTEIGIGVSEMVPCNDLAFVPMATGGGLSQIEARACRVGDIRNALLKVANSPELRKDLAEKGMERAKEWAAGVHTVNDVLKAATAIPKASKIKKVLFAQHSAAGDVLMTTQCFKGIKERHKNMPLVYMTQPQYQDVVAGNPYIDEIIDWDERKLKEYQIVYNPHGEHILPGGWNNLDVTLHSMYPYFCKVEADEIAIECMAPDVSIMEKMPAGENIGDGYIAVHTTGGSKMYRSYPHMDMVIKGLDLPVVQIGGKTDIRCKSDIDLCGKLTFRESAWVMKYAKAAVVIDSFLSHLAGAVGTHAVVLYGPAPARVVGPRAQHGAKIINLQPDMLAVCKTMSHCWGTNPQCQSPCIHTISPQKVRKALEELL